MIGFIFFRNRCVEIFIPTEEVVSPSARRLVRSQIEESVDQIDPSCNFDNLSAASTFQRIKSSCQACLLPQGLASSIAEEALGRNFTSPDEMSEDALPALNRTPCAEVSLLSHHPEVAVASFQLQALADLVKRKKTGSERQAATSFLKLSPKSVDPKQLLEEALGTDLCPGEAELRGILSGCSGGRLDRRFFSLDGEDGSEDNARVMALEIATTRAELVGRSSSARTVALSELLSRTTGAILDFLSSLKESFENGSPSLTDATWMLLWRTLANLRAMRAVFSTDRPEEAIRVALAVGKKRTDELASSLEDPEALAEAVINFGRELFAADDREDLAKVEVGSRWKLGGSSSSRSLSRQECLQFKKFLKFAAELNPYKRPGDFSESRRVVLSHRAFVDGLVRGLSSSSNLSASLGEKGADDSLPALLEEYLVSCFNLANLVNSDASVTVASTYHPLPLKMGILHSSSGGGGGGRFKSKFSWSQLRTTNGLLLHHLLQRGWSASAARAAAVALLPHKARDRLEKEDDEGREREDPCSLRNVASSATFVSECLWSSVRNGGLRKAGSLQHWRLLAEVGVESFRQAVQVLGYVGEEEEELGSFLRGMWEGADLRGREQRLLASNLEQAEKFKKRQSPLTSQYLLLGLSATLLHILCAFVHDRAAAMEAEAARLRREAAEARTSVEADLRCFTLSLPLEERRGEEVSRVLHHPLHARLSALASESEAEAERLEVSIPTRVESREQLMEDVRGLQEGLLSSGTLEALREEVSKAGGRAKYCSWRLSLVNFVQDLEVRFSSFPDVVAPACSAVLLALAGLDILEENGEKDGGASEELERTDCFRALSRDPNSEHHSRQWRRKEDSADFDLLRISSLEEKDDGICGGSLVDNLLSSSDAADLLPRPDNATDALKVISTRGLVGAEAAQIARISLVRHVTEGPEEDFCRFDSRQQAVLEESMRSSVGRLLRADATKGNLVRRMIFCLY